MERTPRRSAALSAEVVAIGARVGQLRKERGVTQAEVAELLGVTQPVVSEYERGSIPLRADQVLALSRLLHVSSDVLLGLKAEAPLASAPDSRLARRLREAQRLPRRDRDALLRTLDAFLAKSSASAA